MTDGFVPDTAPDSFVPDSPPGGGFVPDPPHEQPSWPSAAVTGGLGLVGDSGSGALAAAGAKRPADRGNALNDVVPEIQSAATSAAGTMADTLNPFSEARHKVYAKAAAEPSFVTGLGDLAQQTLDTGKGLLAGPETIASPLTGAAHSLLGHPMADIEHGIGSVIAPGTAAQDNPEEMYQHAKGDVDTALSAMRPAGTPTFGGARLPKNTSGPTKFGWQNPVEAPPQVPQPPALTTERNPLGVTLTQGEADADLALRHKEQAAIRGADPHAQAFVAQRQEQLAQARANVARGLDPTGTLVAESPLDAADIVSQDLVRREDLARSGRQDEAARLQPPQLPHPLDTAATVADSLRNSADTLEQSQQAREVALQNSRENLRSSLSPTGTVLARTPGEAADIVSSSVDAASENAQAATAHAYDKLRTLPGQFHPASFNTVGAEIEASLNKGSNPIRLSAQKTPEAQSAINDLEDILSGATQQRDPVTGQIIKKPPLTPQVIEEARKRLNSFYGNALQSARGSNDWSDVRAMRGVMDAFDDAVEKRLTDGRYTGGNAADVASTMKWARGLHAQYRKTFTSQGAGDSVGAAVQQIVGRYEGQAAPPNQIQGMLYGNGPLPVKIAKRLKSVFDPGSPEIGAVKQGLFSSIVEKPEGVTAWGSEQVADNIYNFLNGKGKALADEYLTPAEKAAWKGYADQLRASIAPPPQPGDVVARSIGQITGTKGTPSTLNEIADALYGRAGVGENPLGVKLAQHIKDTYGEASEPFTAIRNGMAAKLLRTAEGRAGWDPKGVANSIDEFLNGRGKTMANTLYSPEEQATWRSYADALRQHAASDTVPDTPVARAIARISGADGRDPLPPAQVRDLLWNRTLGQDKVVPIGVAKYLKNLYGETSPQWSALKQGLFQRMTEPGGDLAAWGPGKTANQISRFMDIDGRDLANIMFSPEERASIRAYADLMRKIEMPPGSYFPSAPGIAPLLSTVANRVGQLIGAVIGRSLTPSVPIVGEFAGITIGGKMEKALERWHGNVAKQMPLIGDEMRKWQAAQGRLAKNSNWATKQGALVATTSLQKSLVPLGIDLSKLQLPGSGAAQPSQEPKQRADGGATDTDPPLALRHTAPFPEKPEGYEYYDSTPGPGDSPVGQPVAGPATKPAPGLETSPGGGPSPSTPGADIPLKELPTAPSPQANTLEAAPLDVPGVGPVLTTTTGMRPIDRLTGMGGQERFQTWPERMIRSGATLAGDVSSGTEPDYTGLRREDFTDIPGESQPMDRMIQRSQDMAALAGGAGMPAAEEGAVGMAGGKLPPGWKTVEGEAAATPPPVSLDRVLNYTGMSKEDWLKLSPADRNRLSANVAQRDVMFANPEAGAVPPKELAVKQLYTPQEMLKRGEQFDIPDPSKLSIQHSRTIGENPKDMYFVSQPDSKYASYAPHVTTPITGFYSRAEAEGFIKAAQRQQRPADYTGPKLYSDTSQPATALAALRGTRYSVPELKEALTRYTSDDPYTNALAVNYNLREPGSIGGDSLAAAQDLAPKIDQAFHDLATPLPKDTTFWRVAPKNAYATADVDKGFFHTTKDRRIAQEMLDQRGNDEDTIYQVRVPKGTPVLETDPYLDRKFNPPEAGVLLPREGTVTPTGKNVVRYSAPSKLLSDTSRPGAALAALEHTQPFYSAVEQAVAQAPQQKMHGSQWLGWLRNQPGVKAEELAQLGLDKPQQGLVTKADMLKHVQDNGVKLGEVEKGGGNIDEDSIGEGADRLLKYWERGVPEFHQVVETNGMWIAEDTGGNIIGTGNTAAQARATAKNNIREIASGDPDTLFELSQEVAENNLRLLSGETKYADYQLPGGENYREMLLTLPKKDNAGRQYSIVPHPTIPESFALKDQHGNYSVQDQFGVHPGQPRSWPTLERAREGVRFYEHPTRNDTTNFTTSHWEEPNVVAHMRMNDRQIPGVGKSLHLEETQSDIHQRGRKEGYQQPPPPLEDTTGWKTKTEKNNEFTGQRDVRVFDAQGNFRGLASGTRKTDAEIIADFAKSRSLEDQSGKVPDFPFKTTWPDLLLKRAITKAAQEGKDAISWTPGEQQAARYDLSKQVNKLAYQPSTGTLAIHIKNRGGVETKHVAQDKLADVIGKDAAEKLLKQEPKLDVNDRPWHWLEGEGLKVGGEGMKSFYDKMLVDKANAIGKKFGAKVEWKDLPTSDRRVSVSRRDDGHWNVYTDGNFSHMLSNKITSEGEALAKAREDLLDKNTTRVPVLRLTPQLKAQALKGMPLFSDTGKPGAALSALDKDHKQDKQQIPGPIGQQDNGTQVPEPQGFAAGGRVEPANINANPTEAQKKSGAYAKDHVRIQGLAIVIENAKGSKRRGVGKDGRPWESELPAHYGYLSKSEGKDGDNLDVYVGPHNKAPHVFVIDQVDKDTKKFDEHKAMLFFGSKEQALATYKRAFNDGQGHARIGAIHAMTLQQFKHWLKEGDTKAPFKHPPAEKLSHSKVGYVKHSEKPDKHCSRCTMFVPAELGKAPACTLVASPIDAAGWCRHYRYRKS